VSTQFHDEENVMRDITWVIRKNGKRIEERHALTVKEIEETMKAIRNADRDNSYSHEIIKDETR
jgi:hypothetical protein